MKARQRLTTLTAITGLVGSTVALGLAWHKGVGLCDVGVATAGGNATTTGLVQAAAVIAGIDLAVCGVAAVSLRGTDEQLWILLTGVATAVVMAVALALLAGVNFRGC
jgi:hypothetical protein